MCSASRYLLIVGLTAVAVSSLTGSDLLGWLAGAVAAGIWTLVERRLPGSMNACAIAPQRPSRTRG